MNLKHKKLLANRVRVLRSRLENENEKIISEIFIEFANEIDSKINKFDLFEIDFTNFIRNIRRSLLNMLTKNSNRTVQWCKTLFGWKLEGSAINNITSKVINNYNKNIAASKIKGIEETTREIINNIITKGQASGRNTKDIANDIVSSVKDMSVSRARIIATTETANAVNETTHETAVEAGMSKKTWLHVGGGFEDRESHLALDGKTIKVNEYFVINGNRALHPHDQSLPVGEIVNCHCICIYE
ncbi:phage minor head protein [uncultured Clostridium sp.]|uniref:phage minor head protein n=1 Tax=uncultured Clostridium sp. TaxID=59620 RepID=UPI00262F5A18|nr:phage minor head protein [uncultured Clostridium sp.]